MAILGLVWCALAIALLGIWGAGRSMHVVLREGKVGPRADTCPHSTMRGFCRLGPLAWELSLVDFGVGNWAPEAGGIGLLRLGNRWQDHGGTLGAVFVCLVIKTTSKNPSG